MIVGGKNHAHPTAKPGGTAAHVHGHVEHLAQNHLNELALGVGMLQVQPPQNAVTGAGHVVLHEGALDTGFGIAPRLPSFHEPAPGITVNLRFDDEYAGNVGFLDVHRILSCSSPSR